MPARQDQTLQISLIAVIFLFLVSAVLAYLGWKNYGESETKVASLQTSLDKKSADNSAQLAELQDLKTVVGFGRDDSAASVKTASESDMKTYGLAIADEASRTYRKVMETIAAERDQTAARESKLKQQVSEQDKTLLAKETETKKTIDEYDSARKKAQEDLAHEQATFAEVRKGMEAAQANLQKSLDDQRAKYEAQIAEKDGAIKKLTDMVPKLEHQIQNLNAQRKDEPGSFEVADGRITWVNQNGTVWINLGTADALRRQVTFSVFDADQHDAAKAAKKGSIEVTLIKGDHMAEARITKDDPTNPILPGDNVYSQVWHRGKKLHFALTGIIDIDGDGVSDLELARKVIELNGGVVDAYLGDDGKIQGEITANTRYLILGDLPNSAQKAAMGTGFQDMSKTAQSLGVQTITLTQFLDQMGYKPQDRTVHLGTGAKASDFPPRTESGALPPPTKKQRSTAPTTSTSNPAAAAKP